MKSFHTKITLVIIILITLIQTIAIPASAKDYNTTSVTDDLTEDAYTISKYKLKEKETYIQIIHVKEVDFTSNTNSPDFRLYIYLYNPSGQSIHTVNNSIKMSFRLGIFGSASRYYTLKHINHNSTETLYKFEVVGIPNEYIDDFNKEERHYTISGLKINHWSDNITQEYEINENITAYYKGYSAGNGPTSKVTLSFRIENNDQKLQIKPKQEENLQSITTEKLENINDIPIQSAPKGNANTGKIIVWSIIGTIVIIAFIVFFIWIGKDNKKYEKECKKQEADQNEKKQEDKEPEEDPKEEIKAESVYIACSKCGSKNKPLNQYCFYCGTSLKLAFQADENPTKNDSQIELLKNENKRLRTELVTQKDEIRILESKLRIAGVLNNSTENEELKELLDENRELYKKLDAYTANEDYRKRYPAQYLSESGHWVRSKSEREIANFLFQHRIRFVFEKEYTYSSKSYPYYPDFYLPDYHLFIEYFGMYEDPKYNEKTKRKLDIYSQDATKHFEFITFEDDNRLQERLAEICQKYNIPLA